MSHVKIYLAPSSVYGTGLFTVQPIPAVRTADQFPRFHLWLVSLLGLLFSCHVLALPNNFPYGQKLTFRAAPYKSEFYLTFINTDPSNDHLINFQWSVDDEPDIHTDQINLANLYAHAGDTPVHFAEHTLATFALIGALLTITNNHAAGVEQSSEESSQATAASLSFISANELLGSGATNLVSTNDDRRLTLNQQSKSSNFPEVTLYSLPTHGTGSYAPYELQLHIVLKNKNGKKSKFYQLTLDVSTQLTYFYKLIKNKLWFRDDNPDDDDDPSAASRKSGSSYSFWSFMSCCGSGQQGIVPK